MYYSLGRRFLEPLLWWQLNLDSKKEQIIYKVKNLSFTEVEYSSVLGSGSIKAKAGSSLPSFVEGDSTGGTNKGPAYYGEGSPVFYSITLTKCTWNLQRTSSAKNLLHLTSNTIV